MRHEAVGKGRPGGARREARSHPKGRQVDPVALAALSVMTSLTGSVLLALAVAHGRLTPEEAWRFAHLDEDFQAERWGVDAEAMERREARWREMDAAGVVVAALSAPV